MTHRMSNLYTLIVLILLLTTTFVAGCGPGEPAEQPTPASGDIPAESATPATSGEPDLQATPETSQSPTKPAASDGSAVLPEGATVTSSGEPTEQTTPDSSRGPAEQATPAGDENGQPGQQRMPDSSESGRDSDHIEFMVRLLAKADVGDFWFLSLESIRSDPDLAPLDQNLTETWSGWNQEISDELGISLQDAALAVSLPGNAAFLAGIEDEEGLRERMAGLGYQRQQDAAADYWVNDDLDWRSITILPNDVVMIMDNDPGDFLRGGVNDLLKHDFWDDEDWKNYLDGLNTGNPNPGLEVGSADELVSDISNSLLFHFNYRNDMISIWSKAGEGKVRDTRIASFPDEETAKLEEAQAEERLSQLREAAENMPEAEQGEVSPEDQRMRDYFLSCTSREIDRNGREVTSSQVCSVDWFDFRYANYLLSVR